MLARNHRLREVLGIQRGSLFGTVVLRSVSRFDLKRRTVERYFGYYSDEWVKLSLMNYLA